MKQLTINIPDNYYHTFMEYLKKIPEASLLNESSIVVDETFLKLLDDRKSTSEDQYLSREESNRKLK